MTYKGMLLSALLVPATAICSIQDVDLRLHNLSEAQVKKLQELSDISAKIAEKQALIESWDQQASNLFDSAEESYQTLESSLNSFVQKFEKAFCENKDLKGLLANNFSAGSGYDCDFIKVFLVRRYFERVLVARLVEQYEACLKEFIAISRKIDSLQK